MRLREIGNLIGENHPQKIKHHLSQLQKKGLIEIKKEKGLIEKVRFGIQKDSNVVAVPILGSAKFGEAMLFAEDNIEGFLKVSKSILKKPNKKNLFALKAVGDSMDNAKKIPGGPIEEGDYVIVDADDRELQNKGYFVSIIDGCANIKKLLLDKANSHIILISESNHDYPPIYIHENDIDEYLIGGRVVQAIKKPSFS